MVLVGGIFFSQAHAVRPPAIGIPVPELAVFDTVMQDLMEANNITGGELAVMRNGTVVFQRSYGWQDEALTHPLAPDALMRIASCTKPFTAAAVRKLISQGQLSLTNHIFSLGVAGAGILPYEPFGTPDSRLRDITVKHCLQHTGGWDDAITEELVFKEARIAAEMGVTSPPGRTNVVRWIMGQPLQFDPGTATNYSNTGYLLLGLVIEQVSGKDYLTFLRENVTRPIGIPDSELELARTFAEDGNPREPYYNDPELGTNLFYPTFSNDQLVEKPYGTFDMEARDSNGRIITTSRALLTYLQNFIVYGPNIWLSWAQGANWAHSGSLPGSESIAYQRKDGINIAVIFNKRNTTASYAVTVKDTLKTIIDAGQISSWPTNDPYAMPPQQPLLKAEAPVLTVRLATETGRFYQASYSTNLQQWTDWGTPFVGDSLEKVLNIGGEHPRGFLRVNVK